MEFLHIYLLIAAAIFCLASACITKVIQKDTILKGNTVTFIHEYLDKLQHKLDRSRTGISLQQYFALEIGCPAMLAVLAFFLSSEKSLMLIFILLGAFLPNMLITIKRGSENKKFEDRYVRALSQMASSLHSGMTVEQAVDSVVNCELLHQSIREDFRILSSKLKLGTPVSDAFFQFAKMTDNNDAYDVATAITIMTEVGGDAGVAIAKIQKNIEDRMLYRKKRESMMTESKLIAIFSDVIPIFILAGTYVFMPETIIAYFHKPVMTTVFVIIILVLIIGSFVIHKMLNDRVDAS